jgi:hypothetical protein
MKVLSRVLRGGESYRSMRKTHLLFLARRWGYKSDGWCRKDARPVSPPSAKREGSTPAKAPKPAPPPPAAAPKAAPAAAVPERAPSSRKRVRPAAVDEDYVTPAPPQPKAFHVQPSAAPAPPPESAPVSAPAPPPHVSPPAADASPAVPPPGGCRPQTLLPTLAVAADAVAAFASQRLAPRAAACGRLLAGDAARAAATSSAAAGSAATECITRRTLTEARAAASGWSRLRDDLCRSAAPQRAWEAQLRAATAAAACVSSRKTGSAKAAAAAAAAEENAPGRVWSSLLGHELPMEGLTRQMLQLAGASAAWTRRRGADAAARGASAVETTWLVRCVCAFCASVLFWCAADVACLSPAPQDELAEAHGWLLELCTQAQALLGVLKLSRMTTFLAVRPSRTHIILRKRVR